MSKTYQVWLILEETEGEDSPVDNIETYQMTISKTEDDGRSIFEEAQEALEEIKNNLPTDMYIN